MARKPVRKKESSSLGPQIVTILLVVGIFGFLTNQFFKVEEQLAKLHKDVFNSSDVTTKYSFSPGEFALIITTNLKSKPLPANEKLKGFPILSTPLKYKIVHYVGPTLHRGTIELKLAENEALTEAFAADVKTEFIVIDETTLEITNPEIVYKTLDKEIKFGKAKGRISFSGKADLTFDELEYNDPKYKVKLTKISMSASKTEEKLGLNAQALTLNGIDITSPVVTLQKSGPSTFKGTFKELPIDASFQTEVQEVAGKKVPLRYGTYSIPVSFFDAAFNPVIDAQMKQVDEAISARGDSKKSFMYSLTREGTRKMMKMNILHSFTHPKNISVTKDFYVINIPKEDLLVKLQTEIKENTKAQTIADGWLRIPGNQKFEDIYSRIMLAGGDDNINATEIVLKKLENAEANNPLYMAVKARYLLARGNSGHDTYDPRLLDAVKDIASTVNELNPEHKLTHLLNMKLAHIRGDDVGYETNYQKFQAKESDPIVKAAFVQNRMEHVDNQEALRLLEAAYAQDPNHFALKDYYETKAHLYGHLGDKVNQENAYKALVARPEPHLYDLINYSKFLIAEDRFNEARPMVEKCYVITGPQNYCHSFMEKLNIESAYDKVRANKTDEAIEFMNALMEKSPLSMELHFGMGWIWAKKGDKEKSHQSYAMACVLDASNACVFAGDYLYHDKNDIEKSLVFFDLACDKKSALGCMKAGFRSEQKDQKDNALAYFTRACHQLKDNIGCYHQARVFQKLKRPNSEIASSLDLACTKFKAVCKLSAMVKSGNNMELPMHPPGE